ncbi:MAG: hypothetical protein ACI8XO_003581, partial [Verrucomicrobiales bacterium]
MTDQEVAADHLKIIRSLMQRATVYRAISAPAAIFGGIIALVTGLVMAQRAPAPATGKPDGMVCDAFSTTRFQFEGAIDPMTFFSIWLGVLIIVAIFNATLLWRGSQLRSELFFSSGMRLALHATAPPMLAGGVVSYILIEVGGSMTVCALLWVVFYSLALLAARSFAPRSMRWLGWMFFCAGLGLFVLMRLFGHHLSGKFA